MGEEVKSEFIPAQVKVIEHVTGCRSCEKEGTSTKIQLAPMPNS